MKNPQKFKATLAILATLALGWPQGVFGDTANPIQPLKTYSYVRVVEAPAPENINDVAEAENRQIAYLHPVSGADCLLSSALTANYGVQDQLAVNLNQPASCFIGRVPVVIAVLPQPALSVVSAPGFGKKISVFNSWWVNQGVMPSQPLAASAAVIPVAMVLLLGIYISIKIKSSPRPPGLNVAFLTGANIYQLGVMRC